MTAQFHPPEAQPATGKMGDDGKPIGAWTATYPTGERAAEITYGADGEMEGSATQWFREGGVCYQIVPCAGRPRVAIEAGYFRNGTKEFERTLIDGVPHGRCLAWDMSGSLRATTHLSHGRMHGLCKHLDADGNVIEEESFAFGIPTDPTFRLMSSLPGSVSSLMMIVVLAVSLTILLQRDLNALTGLMILALVLVVHEFGHWWVGKWQAIPIESFRIGIGPKLADFLWRQTRFEIHLIPLLGWVRPQILWPGELQRWREFARGETVPTSPSEADVLQHDWPPERNLPEPAEMHLSPKRRLLFYGGGVAMNLLTAWAVIWLTMTPSRPDQAFAKCAEITVRIASVIPVAVVEQFNPEHLVEDQPGLLRGVRDQSREGVHFGQHFALMSILIAVFNLLPIPPLDGYRMLTTMFEMLTGHRPGGRLVGFLTTVGVAFLLLCMGLGVFYLGRDVIQMLRGF